jgi:hypothetical protein
MSLVYNKFKTKLAQGTIDLDTAGDDIRVALLMTNTTADTEDDTEFINPGFTTLDEMDGANYARKTVASEAVNEDLPNNRAEFDFENLTWTALGAGTRDVAGALVFKFVTNDADSIPICFIDTGGFPITANGGDVTIQWNAEGVLQVT